MTNSINNQNSSPTVAFAQVQLIQNLNSEKHPDLIKTKNRFNGLCEIICNRILVDDILGSTDLTLINKKVTVERLNRSKIRRSHLLYIHSIFAKALCFLFGIYPDNIFSPFEQWKLVDKPHSVNRDILKKGFDRIRNGTTLKFLVFKKSGMNFQGHSLLIKKIDRDSYIFFDPSNGEYRNLTFSDLSYKIQLEVDFHHGTDIYLTKGNNFIKRAFS